MEAYICKPDLFLGLNFMLQQMFHISNSIFHRRLIPDISKMWPSFFVFSKAFGTAMFHHPLRKVKYFLDFFPLSLNYLPYLLT